jgi:hypothetical protein
MCSSIDVARQKVAEGKIVLVTHGTDLDGEACVVTHAYPVTLPMVPYVLHPSYRVRAAFLFGMLRQCYEYDRVHGNIA